MLRKRITNIGTWNVQGFKQKINEVIHEINRLNIDIAVITETKRKGQGSENIGEYDYFYSGVPKEKRAQQGVGILIRKKLRRLITTWEAISERLIKMNLTIRGKKITIIGVYAVNDDALVNIKDGFFEKLHSEIANIGRSREIIILGDLNSRTGKKQHNKVIGQYGEETINDNGNRLIALCEQNDMKITNGFFQHRDIHKYTWTQNTRGLKSIIDYTIIRQKTKLIVQDVRVYRGATCGSDHHLLKTKLTIGIDRARDLKEAAAEIEKLTEKKYNLNSLEQESVRDLYRRRLDKKLETMQFTSNEEHYHYIKTCLQEAATEALGLQIKNHRKTPYWWDEEIEEEIKNKREKYKKTLNTRTDADKVEYKRVQAKVRKMICQKKNGAWEQKCNMINTHLGGSRSTESWKVLKSLRQEKKRDIISAITPDQWDEYFEKLLNEDRAEFLNNSDTSNVNILASPLRVTTKEVEEVCKSLKKNKAPGPGNIPAELIKYGTTKLYENLAKLFQRCINGAEIPEEWKTSCISTIHKKGRRDQCDNYRGIAVTSSISRIYGKLIKNKIENEYKDIEAEEQAGFRAGRSTVDHLFCITQIIEKKLAVNQEVHLLYVDLRKAYDSIPQNKLWEALEKTNISANLITATKQLYTKTTARVKVGSRLSRGFQISKGLKQGCCLSPTLFKIYLEQTLKLWKRKCRNMGLPINNNTIYTLSFADDQLVLAQDYDDIEYMTRKLIEEYKKWGLEINIKKTEYMCIGGTQQDLTLGNGEIIKHCDAYKYLGMTITQEGNVDRAIEERNNQGRKAITLLNSILWDQSISNNNKHRIYNAIVKSIITYSSEVWQIKERYKRKLEATEMDFWRRSAGKSRLERVTNNRIREIMNVKHTIVDDINTKQLRWYGHVQRMSEERLPKQILTWTPHGRRKRGRPRLSWREGINREMRERELDEDLWMDRNEWRLGIGRRRRTF